MLPRFLRSFVFGIICTILYLCVTIYLSPKGIQPVSLYTTPNTLINFMRNFSRHVLEGNIGLEIILGNARCLMRTSPTTPQPPFYCRNLSDQLYGARYECLGVGRSQGWSRICCTWTACVRRETLWNFISPSYLLFSI